MSSLSNDVFVCVDCEATGLDLKADRIIEVAAVKFTFKEVLDSFETLIDPECTISAASQEIHHISQKMVLGKPKIHEVLPQLHKFFDKYILVGHGIGFDIALLSEEAKRFQIPSPLSSMISIDTLRLARLYGESPTNSLEQLRKHFNIEPEGAHRAMSDVIVNIEIFKFLSSSFKTTKDLLKRLERPIQLKTMPLGKYKGRRFDEIPLEYLLWAMKKDFDQDLLFSIETELRKRKKGKSFEQASNPFSSLF
jgi:DNA polymerase III subunit epsilon